MWAVVSLVSVISGCLSNIPIPSKNRQLKTPNASAFLNSKAFPGFQIEKIILTHLTWFISQDGSSLRQSEHLIFHNDGQGGGWIEIGPAGQNTGGWYQCTAYNAAGSSATRARVTVDMLPEEPKLKTIPQLNLPYPSRIIEPEYGHCMLFCVDV